MHRKQMKPYQAAGVLAAALLTVSGLTVPAAAAAEGDVNGDGSVNKADAQQLMTWLVSGSGTLDRSAADLDSNGRLTAKDLTLLKRKLI